MKNTVGVVGDIHGEIRHLESLLPLLEPGIERLVFVGDYVDRGAESPMVLERLVRLGRERPCTFLAGNHDLAMRAALGTNDDDFDYYLQLGGAATVLAYVPSPFGDVARQFARAVPAEHISFLSALQESVEVDGLLVAHDIDTLTHLRGLRKVFGVCGHSPQRGGLPEVSTDTAFIDTGCGTTPGGRLTCLLWPSLKWLQSDAQ